MISVPEIDPNYVRTPLFEQLRDVIASNEFYPVFLSGHKGFGKTITPRQVCAHLGRKYAEFQVTPNLLGEDYVGYRSIKDGSTTFNTSIIIEAMREGAVLCLDEIDKADGAILELQNILQNYPVLIKATGEIVKPAPGFTIVATANTKGRGGATNMYITSQVLDAAFIDRFYEFFVVEAPTEDIEQTILGTSYPDAAISEINILTHFAKKTRDKFRDGVIDDFLSTRNLIQIMKINTIRKNIKNSVAAFLNRFDNDLKKALIDDFNVSYQVHSFTVHKNRNNTPTTPIPDGQVDPTDPFRALRQ